jgi:hypothetical protein
MRRLVLGVAAALALAACPKKAGPPVEDDTLPDPVVGGAVPGQEAAGEPEPAPPTTELARRQYAACDRVIPRLTACAVADAKAKMSAEEYAKLDVENTAPIHTRENVKKCKNGYMSSRQVRVYEVCDREETACEPLVACLDNATPHEGEKDE